MFLDEDVWVKQLGHRYEDTLKDVYTGEFYTKESRDEMIKKDPAHLVIVIKMPDEAVNDWMRLPEVAIGTDTMPCVDKRYSTTDVDMDLADLPNMHPRNAGSCGKVLRLGRENGIPLMHQINQLSTVSAKHLGMCGLKCMQERGRVQEGMIADLTIFDYKKVTDNSTYLKGSIPTTGIPYVIVSGKFAVKDGEVIHGSCPGQPIRYPPTTVSKREPFTEDAWKHVYTVTSVDFGGSDPSGQFSCCGY